MRSGPSSGPAGGHDYPREGAAPCMVALLERTSAAIARADRPDGSRPGRPPNALPRADDGFGRPCLRHSRRALAEVGAEKAIRIVSDGIFAGPSPWSQEPAVFLTIETDTGPIDGRQLHKGPGASFPIFPRPLRTARPAMVRLRCSRAARPPLPRDCSAMAFASPACRDPMARTAPLYGSNISAAARRCKRSPPGWSPQQLRSPIRRPSSRRATGCCSTGCASGTGQTISPGS